MFLSLTFLACVHYDICVWTNHFIKSHLWVKSWFKLFFFFLLFIWMFTYGLKTNVNPEKLRLEWRLTPWWQHYDTLPAGFDRVPPRHVTVLSCVSNLSQYTRTYTTHDLHTLHIPLGPSLTRHSLMPHRPIRRRLMRRSVTHLRMHDKVLLDFPVATVCSLLSLLNTHDCTRTHVLTPKPRFHLW